MTYENVQITAGAFKGLCLGDLDYEQIKWFKTTKYYRILSDGARRYLKRRQREQNPNIDTFWEDWKNLTT